MINELDYFNTDEIVCPYCGNENTDSWEMIKSGDAYCDKCEKQFHVEIEERRSYTSKPYPE